ncbi:hypothetical protein [Haloferax sulfurifontis]|uniref:Uncharacterized protein n=2 Tax=Haloferax sulfurifontis TaxID=255616 RepID=M0IIN4_9EURY|nr:hypothetical protein [Haloferax sulfurifontis]ELZ96646.1 hypothetical protein C441_04739 [Haloferax sulfurifontis ATCC BAA-897]GGC72278.1 hypothetical protein GCM10007209_37750 [Haloferax sulfurifontis]
MTDIDPERIKPGDLVKLADSPSEWRVIEPMEERKTAMYSGKLIGVCIRGSPALGGWKPVRNITDHVPRGQTFEDPDNETQTTLAEVV